MWLFCLQTAPVMQLSIKECDLSKYLIQDFYLCQPRIKSKKNGQKQ